MFTLLPLEQVEAVLEAHNVSAIRLRYPPSHLRLPEYVVMLLVYASTRFISYDLRLEFT